MAFEYLTNVPLDQAKKDYLALLVEQGFADVPLHITRFFPQYNMPDVPPTPLAELERARSIAKEEGVRRVKLGNV